MKKNLTPAMGWAVLSGILLTMAFPKINMSLLGWVGGVPLLFAIRNAAFGQAFRLGFVTGLCHYLSLLYWIVPTIHTYGFIPLLACIPILFLLAAYLALYLAIFAGVLSRFRGSPWLFPFVGAALWIGLELARTYAFTGFPWGLLGYSQWNQLWMIQIAEITGVYGVSFLMVLCNGVLLMGGLYLGHERWQGQVVRKVDIIGLVMIIAILIGGNGYFGYRRMAEIDAQVDNAEALTVGVVQGNINQAVKWDETYQKKSIEKYLTLSQSLQKRAPDLIVWPETATPFYFLLDRYPTQLVMDGIDNGEAAFLIGSPSLRKTEKGYVPLNSAYLVHPSGRIKGVYDKVHLVPFGEYVPFKTLLGFLGKLTAQVGDFASGVAGHTLTLKWTPETSPAGMAEAPRAKEIRIGVQICFEIIFPHLSGAMVRNNAAIITTLTNDAWFGTTSAPYQHFTMCVFRAIEQRKALVRSANTGISGFIGPTGSVLLSTPLFVDRAEIKKVPLLHGPTFYTQYRDLFTWIVMGLVSCIAFLQRLLYSKTPKKQLNK